MFDSPDYYQMKVSVFNDDKKTDIIGETWVNLKEVIVPGGGQNDLWHTLSCKGKYAGEIRIEITYYDTRPKPERPERIANVQHNASQDDFREGLSGPRQPRSIPKRRPLPSDPVTGAPASPTAMLEHEQTPPRGYDLPGYVPNQSPLQNVEYNTPPNRFTRSHGYGSVSNMNAHGTPPVAVTPPEQFGQNDRYDTYDPMSRTDMAHENGSGSYTMQYDSNPYDQYSPRQPAYQPSSGNHFQPSSPTGPPPPPPAHRSQPGSNRVSPGPAAAPLQHHVGSPNGDSPSYQSRPYDEFYRHSMPTNTRPPPNPQPQQHQYQAHSQSMNEDQFRASTGQPSYSQSPPRHYSYDERYNANQRSSFRTMQPSVEDAPASPGSGTYFGHRSSFSNQPLHNDPRFDQVPSPAPLNLSGRASAASTGYDSSIGGSARFSNASDRYGTTSSRTSYSSGPQQNRPSSRHTEDSMSGIGYGLPSVPPTLVAGMDPTIAKEISERIYQEKRATANHVMDNSPRGRYQEPSRQQQNRPQSLSYNENIQTPFVPAAPSFEHRRSGPVAGVKPRSTSPNPHAPIKRKSVSPIPAMPDGNRLSGVPFGPDSYNALNPAVSGSAPSSFTNSPAPTPEYDPNAKIITHDGREIDPSDHIPESNYAPLLEPKGPKHASQLPDRNYRPAPTGPQQMSMQRRQPLRQHGRVQSVPTPQHMPSPEPSTPPTGRNRLQKKMHRNSAQPLTNSSPLAPITSYQDNNFTPRSLPRAHTGDFTNENYAPNMYNGSPGYRGSGPPIPAKISMGGGHQPPPRSGGGDPWALLEEMKNIDLGSGRARRRGH